MVSLAGRFNYAVFGVEAVVNLSKYISAGFTGIVGGNSLPSSTTGTPALAA
jgi:hypothetical protein